MVGSSPLLALAFCVACIFGQLFELAQAQNRTQAATDPAEGVTLYLSLSLSHTHTHTHTHTHKEFITYECSWLIRAFFVFCIC